MTHNIFDTFIYEALREKVRLDGRTVWDVGAHIGYHSLTFASLVGRAGHVVAFEPNPYNLVRFRQHLAKNQELEERITLVPCALSNRDGEETFIFSSELDNGRSSGSHLLHAFTPEDDKVYEDFTKMKVSVATIDRLLEQNYLPPPAVVKLDVEGAEGFVLEGATQLLRTIRPILLIEVHHIAAMHSVANILLPVGYSTKIIEDAPNSASRCFIMARPTR